MSQEIGSVDLEGHGAGFEGVCLKAGMCNWVERWDGFGFDGVREHEQGRSVFVCMKVSKETARWEVHTRIHKKSDDISVLNKSELQAGSHRQDL